MTNNTKETERAELHKTIWRIANDLRGSVTEGANKLIRDSTAEFPIFTGQAGVQSIKARCAGDTARGRRKWKRK
jgi:hypothetical protein